MLARIVLLIFFLPEWIVTFWVFRSPRVRRWRARKHPAQALVVALFGMSVFIAFGGLAVANTLMHGVPRPTDRGLMRMFNVQQLAVACATLWMARSWIPKDRVERRAATRRTLVRLAILYLVAAVAIGSNIPQWSSASRAVVVTMAALGGLMLLILLVIEWRDKRARSRTVR